MTTSFSSSHVYEVVDDQAVFVSVIVGNAARGSSEVILAGKQVAAGTRINHVSLGLGKDIRGNAMVVTSSAVATENFTSNEVKLEGGTVPADWIDQNAASPGDNVVYTCTVVFT